MNRNVEIGQLILRIGLGLTFMIHGYLKFAGASPMFPAGSKASVSLASWPMWSLWSS